MFPSLSALDVRSLCVSGALSEDARREAENDEISKRECPRGLYCEDPIQAEMMSEYIRTYLTVNGKHTVVDTLNSGASGKYSKIYVVMPAVLKLRDSRKGLREMLEPLIESLLENYGKPDAQVGVVWLYEIQDPNMPEDINDTDNYFNWGFGKEVGAVVDLIYDARESKIVGSSSGSRRKAQAGSVNVLSRQRLRRMNAC